MSDDDRDSEALTHLLRLTGSQSIGDIAGKVYLKTKTFLGIGKIHRKGVPALLTGFEPRMIDGKRRQCVIVKYHDGTEFALPTGKLFKGFAIVDPAKVTTTYIEKDKLEKGM